MRPRFLNSKSNIIAFSFSSMGCWLLELLNSGASRAWTADLRRLINQSRAARTNTITTIHGPTKYTVNKWCMCGPNKNKNKNTAAAASRGNHNPPCGATVPGKSPKFLKVPEECAEKPQRW